MYDLSILIPARNEMFLSKTIDNILENIEANTEIIVALDGEWADPPIKDNERVTIVHFEESIGQRGATNAICRLSKAKWVMKVDAHCAFDKGFDRKMLEALEGHENWTAVPVMRNLHAFDWVCEKCGNRWYQGPTPTHCFSDYDAKNLNPNCDGTNFHKDIQWRAKNSPRSASFCFDSEPHFQYFGEYCKTDQYKKDLEETGITESMSLQGSCFMLTREKYWELNICDETFGSWGSQGIEVACKTWLSGGRVVCVQSTWYAHMFRTQGGDFSFPYPLPGNQVQNAKKFAKSLFMDGKWDQQIKPLSWLLEKFWPVKGWDFIPGKEKNNTLEEIIKANEIVKNTEFEDVFIKKPTKGIIFYTDNQLKLGIAHKVQDQLKKIGLPIVSASLKPMSFGENVHLPLKRGYLTMFKQILAALEKLDTDIVFFCEHDVLYHPSHFDFMPEKKDIFYYNENVWKVDNATGKALHYDCKQVSGICVYRDLAIQHYKKRIKLLEDYINPNSKVGEGFSFDQYVRAMGFEPGTHNRPERVDDLKSESWFSEFPNVDIRHDNNLTASRWSKEQFRNQSNCKNWIESDEIPGWGKWSIIK